MPKIPPVKLPILTILDDLYNEIENGLEDKEKWYEFRYVDENGIIELSMFYPDYYSIKYTLFRYGNIYEKYIKIYKSRKYHYQLEKNGLYFLKSYSTRNLKGRNTLTDKEIKERKKYFDYISVVVDIEEFNMIP